MLLLHVSIPQDKKRAQRSTFRHGYDVIDAVEMYLEDQDSSFYEEAIHKLHDR